ncbi:MAG TPA: hypothetical protein PLP17_15015, partial [Oligoflexia bacterium]|nr:hypothetical protein [Oligoflexia bacterium]
MKKKQGNSEAAAPKRRSFLVLRITAWVAAGALLGLSHAFGHTLAGAYLAAAFALSIALLYRLLPSRQWWELYLAGYAAHAVCCHWLAQIIQVYSAMPLPLAILCAGLLFVFPALQFVVFDLVHRGLCGKFLIRHSLALPLAWLAVEALFPKLIPWYLGQAESKFLILAQAADIAGPALISFLLFWWAALLVDGCAALAGNNASGAVRKAVLLALAFSLTFVYGRYRLYSLDKALAQSNPLRLALVQGNLDPFHDYFDGKMEDRLAKLRGISRDFLAQHDPDILVWPESSAGYDYYPEHLGARLTQEQDPYPELHVPLVFGGQLRAHTQHADQPHYYNSAFLRMPDASLAGAYRKQEHFPFSERVPLSNYFPALEKLRNRDYVPLRGEDEKPFSLTVRRISNNRPIRIATAICFEDMWP